ncbi:MAG: thiamine-phosphate kinase [Fibrobacterota bacterium]|nr:thiamine-phosphate kinase [Chitinispirillaceae bacterium]
MNHPSTEHELISELKTLLQVHSPRYEVEIGDDAAVRKGNNSDQIILTADLSVEDVHFRTEWMTFREIGYKAMATNLSDCASMGASPESALIQLVFPKNDQLLKDRIIQLYQGFNDACMRWDFPVIGGDLSAGNSWVIGITLLGHVPSQNRTLKRSGAQDGDRLWVSGETGNSLAGLHCLQKWGRTHTPDQFRLFIDAHVRPEPQIDLGLQLRDTTDVRAMMDLSDGLAKDARTMGYESDLGVILNFGSSHISPIMIQLGKFLNSNPFEWVIQGGEEYELLFAASGSFNPDSISGDTARRCRCIGTFTSKRKGLWYQDGSSLTEVSTKGWNHF